MTVINRQSTVQVTSRTHQWNSPRLCKTHRSLYTDASFNSHNSALATRQTGRGSRLQTTSPAKQLLQLRNQLPLRQTCFGTACISSGINNVTSPLTTKLEGGLIGFTISADKLVTLTMSLPSICEMQSRPDLYVSCNNALHNAMYLRT